jgi:hypothetical protein
MAGTARIINTRQVEQALLQAFEEWTKEDVNDKYWREKFEDRYPYPGPATNRKAKPPAGNPRDILDTEALYESGVKSYSYEQGANGAKAEWHWNAENSSGIEYAWFVHEGQGPYSRAPRPWTDELASEWLFGMSDIKQDLIEAIDRHLNG